MKKKLITIVAVILAAAALVIGSVAGTVAYLTASAAVSNVFTVGNVAIEMFESKVNSDGTLVDPSVAAGTKKTADSNSYHLLPGQTYVKDPTIYINETSDSMYLFVKTSNQIRTIEVEEERMRTQMEQNGWVEYKISDNNIDIIWVYGTKEGDVITPTAVTATSTNCGFAGQIALFDHFTIKSDADVSIYGGAKVTATAYAIQTSGMNSVEDAWNAIVEVYPYESGIIGE
ncbi:MAG: hypothetical protein IJW46_04675 [Clostridia bacterium]|nr:hypothetical protein [Clostridia bacterium]